MLYAPLGAEAYPIFVPLKTSMHLEDGTEHHQREFLVLDPDGDLLRFTD
ncbi:hypothetical protein [Deinococcus alpinitundrae]|nr:hypothetical protein [Deinococcus alpinitundrae]